MDRRISWLRVLVESVAIVASILLAFGVDAWWDRHREALEEQTALQGLYADLTASVAQLDDVVRMHETYDEQLIALDTMTASRVSALAPDSAFRYVVAMTNIYTFDARDGTLDGLIASGRLGLIESPALRSALIEWKARVEDLTEESSELRVAGHRVSDRITALGGPWSAAGPEPFFRTTPSLNASWRHFPHADLQLATGDEELMSLVRSKRFWALIYLSQLLPLREQAEGALALVQAELR
jgi:hypothetical protein